MPVYRSKTSTAGRNMAGARSLWRATGMKDDDFSKPIIAVVNSRSHSLFARPRSPQKTWASWWRVRSRRRAACQRQHHRRGRRHRDGPRRHAVFAAQPRHHCRLRWNTWSTRTAPMPWCASQLRQDHPRHADGCRAAEHPRGVRPGGPMEAGKVKLANPQTPKSVQKLDLIDAMVMAADDKVSDADGPRSSVLPAPPAVPARACSPPTP